MSDTPKVSAAEALEAYNNVLQLVASQRIIEGTGKLFSDLNSASTNDETLRKFIAQQAALESAASDLLAALEELTDPIERPDAICHAGLTSIEACCHCGRHARARAAIAKARGGAK